MNTNDQTKTPSMMQHRLRNAAIAAASVALGLTAASAQMAPTQPAPAAVTPPAVPAAAPAGRAASQYETVFKRIDADNDGSITQSELEKADGKLGADFKKYDTDGDGKLSMPEFAAMMKSMQG